MAALTILKNSSNSIALQTYQSLVNHHVRVDEIADLTLHDFKRVLKDYADDSIDIGLRQDQYADLTRDDSAAQKILEEHLAGYQWEDRIYVSRSQSAKDLASTLIHEVNHVLNHSHLHYYAQKIDAFREEYRAFYVEKAALGFDMNDHALTLKIKRQVIRDYHFDELSPDDIGNRPTGFITPSEENWQRAATRD